MEREQGGKLREKPAAGRARPTRSKDRIRLLQLVICILLFVAVFVGRGVFPQRLAAVRTQVLELIGANTDFRGALEALGGSLAERDSLLGDLGSFCIEVFGPGENKAQQASAAISELKGYQEAELRFLSSGASSAAQTAHMLRLKELPEEWQESGSQVTAQPEPAAPQQESVPAIGTVILHADYTGAALPEKYTMDQLSFGSLETMAPLSGTMHSGYGYRDHPINGKYSFHGGVDIGGQKGDPIGAFADGTVEYIGKNDTYGQYLQLDHGDGIKSFYAHCSKLYVKKGETVKMGDRIAAVGSTGSATGPHLHFELKCGGIHVDPSYYLGLNKP